MRIAPGFRVIFETAAIGWSGAMCLASNLAIADSHQTSALRWVEPPGAEGCGGAPAIARAVEERLGRHAIVSPAHADLSIEARAERSGHPPLWHAVVVLRNAEGKVLGIRELGSAADDCGELRSAVALAAALMIDPDAALRSKDLPSPEPPTPSPAVPSQQPEPAVSVPAVAPAPQVVIQRVEVPVLVAVPSPPPTWRVVPSASFALGFGVLPTVATGVRAGVTVMPPRTWAFEAFGGAWGNQTTPAEQGAQVRFSVTEVGLALCPLSLGGGAHPLLTVCGGAEVAFFETESQGFAAPRRSVNPAVRVVVPGRLSLPVVRGVAVRIGGEVGMALLRDQFVYDDASGVSNVVSGSPLVTAECDLGLSVSLP